MVANAAPFLEPEETVHASALVKGPLANYVLIATERNVYALKLGGLGFSKVKEATLKIPLDEVIFAVTDNGIAIGRRDTDEKRGWQRMPFQKVDELVAYLEQAAPKS